MTYRISNVRLDPVARLLQRDGELLDVPRRVFDCLAYLVEHRSRAVGRDELIEQVWHRSNVSDNQLAQTVLAARRLLDDDGVQQRMIRTVAGFGYHFIGVVEVEGENAGAAAAPVDQAPATMPPPLSTMLIAAPPRRQWLLALFALALLASAGSVWWLLGQPAAVEQPMAAATATTGWTWVLPAQVADADGAWARIGIASLIAERLRHNGAIVVPIENVLARLGEHTGNTNPDALRRELAATRVILPSISRDGKAWRVELAAHAESGISRASALGDDLLLAGQQAADALSAAHPIAPAEDSLSGRAEMIEQLIRSRDFESAASQLARLPESEHALPQARLLEIMLAMEQGRMSEASELAAALRSTLSAQEFPAAAARLGLFEIALMRHRSAPGWGDLVDASVARLEKHGSPRDLGSALIQRGNRAAIGGNYDTAQTDFARAQQLFLNAADELGGARAGASLALLANARGRPAEALRLLADCEAIYARYAAIGNQFAALRSMMSIQFGMLRWEDAQATSERARALAPLMTDANERVSYLRARALLMLGTGRLREAAALLDESERMRQLGELSSEANRSDDLYRLQLGLAQGRYAQVATAAIDSYARLEQEFDPKSIPRREQRDLALYLWFEARRQLRLSDPSQALPPIQPEPAALNEPASMHAWLALGHRELERGDLIAAESDYRKALQLAIEANKLSRMVTASDALIGLLLASGRVDDANEVVTGVLARDPQVADRDFDSAVLLMRVRRAQGDDEGWRRAARSARQLAGERVVPAGLLPPD